MYNPGWGPATLAGLYRIMTKHHRVRIRVQLMTHEHVMLGDISERFVDGSVDVDADAEVTRSLDITLLDPDKTLNLDSSNPRDGGMYLDRMIQVWYCVAEIGGSTWWEVPVFTGPVDTVDRSGPILQVTCQGKEIMGRDLPWQAYTYPKGLRRIDLVKELMRNAGERRMRIQGNGSKTSAPTVLNQKMGRWSLSRMVANNANMNLFYDGAGTMQLLNRTENSRWTFRDDALLTYPNPGLKMEGLVNAADVTGAVPKGSKTPVRFRYVAPKAHPLSPWSLARNGVGRVAPVFVKDDRYKTVAQCRAVAVSLVNKGLLQSVDVQFDTFPMPMLEEYDYVTVQSAFYYGKFQVRKFSLPLGGGPMTINRISRTSPKVLSRKFRSL